jgi:predicted amidohydrolase YtcJ
MLSALIAWAAMPAAPADLVIENARIWSDGLPAFAEFAAVRSGRFVAVGDRDGSLIGPQTVRIDAQGSVVVPGLVDSHIHMLNGGLGLSQLMLRDARDRQDFVSRIQRWASELPEERWVLGGRWSTESWAVREQPTKEWVDGVTASRPLYLPRMDGHSALANSAALRIAGITQDGPPDPPGGVIDRDPATGEPTGILREAAMALVSRHVPSPSREEKVAALRRAIAEANRHGITTVSDIPSIGDLNVYEELARSGGPSVRLMLYPTADDWSVGSERIKTFRGLPNLIEVRGFKAFFDGSLGSRTAYMKEPFLGNAPEQKDWRGLPMPIVENGTFLRNAVSARQAGLQSIVHAIGDLANSLLLDQLGQAYPNLREARCRSEHAQHLLREDIARFGRLGVIASMQPYHKADDGRYAEDSIGPDRSRSSYAFKSLLDAGTVVAFGSDWPVVSMNPFLGVEAAVTGNTLAGRFWQTQENITVAEALRSYTTRGAFACRMEREIGRIAPGYRADFVMLNKSPFEPKVRWSDISPTRVYLEGRLVHQSSGASPSSESPAPSADSACTCQTPYARWAASSPPDLATGFRQ